MPFQRKRNESKTVVVTGASAGVGRAIARKFGAKGYAVGLIARGREGLDGARADVERLGGRALALPADVSVPEQVEAAADAVERQLGPIDIWVNNAMVSMYAPFWQMSADEFRHVTDVTYHGYVHGTRAALARMMPRDRGVIVQVSSALAHRSIPLQSAYCGAKHAIKGFTEAVRCELLHEKSRVRLSMVALPGVNTPQFQWTKNRMGRKVRPAGAIFQPEVPADAVMYVAEHDRKEVLVGYPTVESVVGEKVASRMLDRYLATNAWEGALLPEPADPQQPDNFWHPVPGDHGAHGTFDAEAKSHSVQLWATKNRAGLFAAAAGLGLAAVAYLADRRRD